MRKPIRRTETTRTAWIPVMVLAVFLAAGPTSNVATADSSSELAGALIDWVGFNRGVCVVVGAGDDTALDLARVSQLLVHVREADAASARRLRRRAHDVGFGIQRLAVESGSMVHLPYADNMVDFLVVNPATSAWLERVEIGELMRVLRPRGVALIRAKHGDDRDLQTDIKTWIAAADVGMEEGDGVLNGWIRFQKPPIAGLDEWTHWEKGPDNNPVSTDQMIKAPYMTQFMAKPYYIGMPSITTAAGGRTFLAIGHIAHHRREWDSLNKIIARNGYNGTVLWERDLPEGYLVHRSAFVATEDTFYMIDNDRCLALDSETGSLKSEIRIPGLEGEWKWMCMKDGILFALAGKPGPGTETTKGDRTFGGWSWSDLSKGYYGKQIRFSLGDTLAAYHPGHKRCLWIHNEKSLIDARGMAMRQNRLYLYCPDRHVRCISAKTGEILWTNDSSDVMDMTKQPGSGLRSTPGFRTACITVATPRALIVQGQTRMNVVALSTDSGSLLWTKKKITNNPNAIFIDENIVLGVGPGGNHVVIDPVTGKVIEDLKFQKVACTRLTASTDSFFCRGEGLMRFDRAAKKPLIDGAVRPACNDGALPANGMLYLGPWQCDCNLSLIGRVAKCSAGDFDFVHVTASEAERLEDFTNGESPIVALSVSESDWPTYRHDNHRTAGTSVAVATTDVERQWEYVPSRPHVPTAPTAAGGLIFFAGEDGRVCALDGKNGELRWDFSTPSPIKYPPTIWAGRAFVGGGDGYVYTLEAATGRLLWRFRGAPRERHVMIYDSLQSTWPVGSGVLVHEGIAYFAAGIVDHDGTYVYALDAKTGRIRWQNNSSGHLNSELRKGVSVQGNLAIQGDRLLLAGGNQVSPAPYNLATGECLAPSFEQGSPKANHGKYVGVFQGDRVIAGGRILYSAPANVANKGSFVVHSGRKPYRLNYGGVPPAWSKSTFAMVNFKRGKLTCCNSDKVSALIEKGPSDNPRRRDATVAAELKSGELIRWQSDLGESNKFETVSLAVCPGSVVAVLQYQQKYRSQPQWYVVAFDVDDGKIQFQHELRNEPLPGGLLVDREGQAIVCMLDGSIICLGAKKA